jgi:ABC-type amino acid transport substrate-binding protein
MLLYAFIASLSFLPGAGGFSIASKKAFADRGVMRVGYMPDEVPFSFFNAAGKLVGFDIDMAHILAKELEVKIEFIPVNYGTMAQLLEDGRVDIVMSGIGLTTSRLRDIEFSQAYLDVTFALAVDDHRRDQFQTLGL